MICEWSNCEKSDLPIILTVPDSIGDKQKRVRFCCYQHLAAWAIIRSIKQVNSSFAANQNTERAIVSKVDEIIAYPYE